MQDVLCDEGLACMGRLLAWTGKYTRSVIIMNVKESAYKKSIFTSNHADLVQTNCLQICKSGYKILSINNTCKNRKKRGL